MRSTWIFLPLVLASFTGLLQLNAQTSNPEINVPSRGFFPAHSYAISDIEAIDKAAGSLSLHIPITQLPPGPGGFTAGVTLTYNSKYWDTVGSSDDTTSIDQLIAADGAAWRLVMAPRLEVRFVDVDGLTQNPDPFQLRIVEPDGSSHLLIASSVGPQGNAGFGIYYIGEFEEPTENTKWHTIDGSFLQLVLGTMPVDYDAGHPVINPVAWTLRRNDGTSVEHDDAGDTILSDRNGNAITVSRVYVEEESVHTYEEIEDAYGRTIRIDHYFDEYYPHPITQDEVTQVGHDKDTGNPLRWIISYQSFPTLDPADYLCRIYILQQSWNETNLCGFVGLPLLISALELPNGLTYDFSYDAQYGELSEMALPTGAAVEYEYRLDGDTSTQRYWDIASNTITSKIVQHDAVSETWTYSHTIDNYGNISESSITAPDGGVTSHEFAELSYASPPAVDTFPGLLRKITNPDGSILHREWDVNNSYDPQELILGKSFNPWVKTEWETTADSAGQPVATSKRAFTSDKNGNITSREETEWVTACSGDPPANCNPSLLRKTVMTYVNQAGDSANTDEDENAYSHTSLTTARNLIESSEAQNASGDVVSRSEYHYETQSPRNLLAQYSWDSTKASSINQGASLSTSNAIVHSYTYTTNGNLASETDPNGNETSYTYGTISDCPTSGSDLYRTGMQRGGTTSVQQNWSYGYNCYSGLQTGVTDPNGLVSTTTYDKYGRPTSVSEGGLRWSQSTYPEERDGGGNHLVDYGIVTEKDVVVSGDVRNVIVSHYDQLGRLRLTQQVESKTSASAAFADEDLGIKSKTKYVFSSGKNDVLVSNPYRESDSTASSPGWTATRYDTVGRVCAVETFDGATEPTLASSCTSASSGATGRTTYVYNATTTYTRQTITDPAGAVRELRSDVLGHVITVIEDPSTANYTTSYEYDLRGNLTGVTQGSTVRAFTYSSLNRLLTAENPESGETSYSYDNAGNLSTKTTETAARTSTYDDLNRVLTHDYNDSTPDVTFTYDAANPDYGDNRPSNCSGNNGPIGRLTKVSNSVSTNFYYYNRLGNTVCNRQKTGTEDPFDFAYAPTPQGEWKEITYPSGRTVNTGLDGAGRPVSVAATSAYASNVQYMAHGAIRQLTLGNLLVETSTYNGRLQLTDRKLGTTAGSSDRWRLQNGYSSTANNGNVLSQTLTIQGAGGSWETDYGYDGLNRLTLAAEEPSSSPDCPDSGSHWCQAFGYDARGNRTVSASSNLGMVVGEPTSFGTDNRITDSGFGYDDAGNLKVISTNDRYVYDGENRQVAYCPNTVSETDCNDPAYTTSKTFYGYDGEGRRVTKTDSSGTMVFVYDARGQLMAEYGGTEPETATQYVTADHLGSTRVVTDQSKAIVMCRDYLPFGGEILATTGNGRNGITCYSEDETTRKFTGKERDAESKLDYFGARYFSWASGRFNSPDEWTGGLVDAFTGKEVGQPGPLPYADITDPQTINKYVYVRNNPLRYTDPDGHAIDYLLDAAGIAFDINEIRNDPSVGNFVQLGVDIVLAATPIVPTIGAVKLGGKAVDVTVDAGRAGEKAANAGKSAAKLTDDASVATTPYKRPSGATTPEQRVAVQGKPCVDCGQVAPKMNAGHKKPLVKEHYETGTIDKDRMRKKNAVQPHCPTCSNREGANLSRYSREKRKRLEEE